MELIPVVTNLVRNYSPHLAPDTRSAPPTVELRNILGVAANEMLEEFLTKWRTLKIRADQPAVTNLERGMEGLAKKSMGHPSAPVSYVASSLGC
jgi:hypothetical protein